MNIDKRILRICTAVILCAVLLRAWETLAPGEMSLPAAFVFLQSGRVLQPKPTEPVPPSTEPTAPVQLPSFTAADADGVKVYDYAGVSPDVETLLLQPLSWELTGEAPTVLILHTHATESYTNTEGYEASSPYRTLDEDYNVISVGEHIAELLRQQGIGVIHDRTLHDYPSYNGSYDASRATVAACLEQYPSIRLVLDIHRDAMTDDSGAQLGYTVSTEKGPAAKVMLVVGCNHSGWEENAALAAKLQVRLEELCPGICRPLVTRASRFNQDLSPGAVLIELGAAGNTRQEALLAAEYVAQAIAGLAMGTK